MRKLERMTTNSLNRHWLAFALGAGLLATGPLLGADAKTYQVTGPVLELSPTTITVQKGNDKWELARNSGTKVKGDLKVGSRVTIYYTMVAAEVEVKEPKSGKDGDKTGKKDGSK
jgi:hypothetical protein